MSAATANVPKNLVPDWLLDRFDALYRQPHHEASSYYGPINMMLTTFFPSTMRFVVRTPARLRDPLAPGRSSSDPYDQIIGTSDKDGNPDFLVCIRTSTYGADVPFLIYVVKRDHDDDEEVAFQLQMERYIQWARRYQIQVSPWARIDVIAVLVMGAKSQVYSLSPDADFINTSPYEDTTSNYIFEILRYLRDTYASGFLE
jgi:hypothetical protein